MDTNNYSAIQGILLGYSLRTTWLDNDINHTNRKYQVRNNTMIIRDLWPYSLYNISVAGFTKYGDGPRSSIQLRTEGKGLTVGRVDTIVIRTNNHNVDDANVE